MDSSLQRGQPRGELHQPGRQYGGGMRLRLPGAPLHEESHRQRDGRQPWTLPVPWLPATSGVGHAGQPERASDTAVGSAGSGSHASPGLGAGQCSVLLWHGLQQKRDGGLRWSGSCCGGLWLLSLWDSWQHRQSRPARPVVQRDERRRTRPGLLQLPLLQSRWWKVDQSRSHRRRRRMEFVCVY